MILVDPSQMHMMGVTLCQQFSHTLNYDTFSQAFEVGRSYIENAAIGTISTTSTTTYVSSAVTTMAKVAPIITVVSYVYNPNSFTGHLITGDVERQFDEGTQKLEPILNKIWSKLPSKLTKLFARIWRRKKNLPPVG